MKYEEYKDVNAGWINKIPSHWYTIPIKYTVKNPVTSFIDGDWIESKVIKSDGIRYLTTGNVGVLEYKEQGSGFISEETFAKLNCTEVFPGDLLISRLNEPIARTCIVPDLGYRIVVAVDNVIYRPETSFYDKRFIMYQMNCSPYAENAFFIARGSTMPRISRTMLGAIKLCVPPLSEQQAIATYLDEKCGEINRAIDVQKKKIDLLNELKQTIITDAVTKGLDPDIPMKDSGVEWIGEIPAHWEKMNMRFLISDYKAGPFGSSLITNNLLDDGDILVYTPEHIAKGETELPNNLYLPNIRKEEMSQFVVNKGNILIPIVGSLGRAMIIEEDMPTGIINQRLAKFNLKKDMINPKYFLYYFAKSQISETYNILNSRGSIIVNLTKQIIYDMPFVLPPLKEQVIIVNYLDKKTAAIDIKIIKAERHIELLEELKQSIITEAVTGKIKVC